MASQEEFEKLLEAVRAEYPNWTWDVVRWQEHGATQDYTCVSLSAHDGYDDGRGFKPATYHAYATVKEDLLDKKFEEMKQAVIRYMEANVE